MTAVETVVRTDAADVRRRVLIALIPILWTPLLYGPMLWFSRNTEPTFEWSELAQPLFWAGPLDAGTIGLLLSLRYWSPAVSAVGEAVSVLLLPILLMGVLGEAAPFLTLYNLVTFYWLFVGVSCFFVARGLAQRSVFQKRYPGPLDAWDEDDD